MYPIFSGWRVHLCTLRLHHWPAWLTIQLCRVKEHLKWPSVNRVPSLLRYFMLCIFFACMFLWLPACWDCGFISHRGHVCLSVCSECCVLSGRGLCDGLITHPELSYRVWCIWVWLWSHSNEEALAYWGLLCNGGRGGWICFAFLGISVLQVDICQISLILAIWRCLVVW